MGFGRHTGLPPIKKYRRPVNGLRYGEIKHHFLRRHYPDQVQGTGDGVLVSASQPGKLPAPLCSFVLWSNLIVETPPGFVKAAPPFFYFPRSFFD
jgi:hypothetical protein